MRRSLLLRQISDELGDAQLVWFGTRGDDVEAAADIPQLRAAFSIVAAYKGRSGVRSVALENLTGIRPDLDTYEIDDEPRTDEMVALRRELLRVLARPSALFTYRPSTFVSAVCFARRDRCRYLGMFKDHQAAFEHKPWVESSIADLGIATIPWRYIADDDQLETVSFLQEGPVMLRRSRTTGGVGLFRVDQVGQLEELWPREDEAFVSVAPYVSNGLPVNVGAVVWHDGVTVHRASVQLIGVAGCTVRPFGYCGNDFAAVGDIDSSVLDEIESAVVLIGRWLRLFGYLGAFGVDFLVSDGVPLFTEVNPRFQGSTHASCQISVEQDESCLLIEHVAALLGVSAPPYPSLVDQSKGLSSPFAHLVVHWTGEPALIDPSLLVEKALDVGKAIRIDVVTAPGLRTGRGGTVARITTRARLTTSGFDLLEPLRSVVDAWTAHPGEAAPGRSALPG